MFGLHKYIGLIPKIKWIFEPEQQEVLQDVLLVDFKHYDGYYQIEKIHYSFMDIVMGMEDIDFNLKWRQDNIEIEIINI